MSGLFTLTLFFLAGDMDVGVPSNGMASTNFGLLEYFANRPRRADGELWSEARRTGKGTS
jgi:hypothetical protein